MSWKEILGDSPRSCEHLREGTAEGNVSTYVVPEEAEDWDAILETDEVLAGATAVQVCSYCRQGLPSVQRQEKKDKESRRLARIDELEENLEKVECGAAYACPTCDEVMDEGDLVPLRECPNCDDEVFDATDGRNCVNCNRPFTRKFAEGGCPDCLDPDELPVPVTEDMTTAWQAELKELGR
ncbi:MAG: hypothetical protein GY769_17655 [bacterium]|nr:hypothetical protein [bacterium]